MNTSVRPLNVTRTFSFNRKFTFVFSIVLIVVCQIKIETAVGQQADDYLRAMQVKAMEQEECDWICWGDKPGTFSNWTTHSNRLIPVYLFGGNLDAISGKNSPYRSKKKLKKLYGKLPKKTFNPTAEYFDQTQLHKIQELAVADGKKNIIVMVFDGMDWQTTQAAAIYKSQKIPYTEGRGNVLSFQTYDKAPTDFGFCVTSAHNNGTKSDIDSQTVTNVGGNAGGGYSEEFGGEFPWSRTGDSTYLMGRRKTLNHIYTDSASSATSIFTGKKTYNAAIGVDIDGKPIYSIAHDLQKQGRSVGVVTSVPFSHATPASAYAHNVSRNDYQDISRDLLGLPSAFRRDEALSGMDVVIGTGFGSVKKEDEKQGKNFIPGNKFLPETEMAEIDVKNGGKYVVAARTPGKDGAEVLTAAAESAARDHHRLFGFFGTVSEHLPYSTADGNFDPARGKKGIEKYEPADISENPTLAKMTEAALTVLSTNEKGFWLMVEPGDIDWANHSNNIDNSIGAVFSGDKAFDVITDWVEKNSNWDETLLIVTADHGHMMNMCDHQRLIRPETKEESAKSEKP